MLLRAAKLDDVIEVAALFLKCWKVSYIDVLSEETRNKMDTEASQELWRNALSNDLDRRTILALENGVLVGFFRVGPDKNDVTRGHLFSLYVSPDFAGQGFGKKLLSAAVDLIAKSSFNQMSLWVFDENIVAKSLYAKFGFEPTGESRTTPDWEALEIEMLNKKITQQF
jgi:ribosomal protein S18 acetylase RimI-like enzyme